MPSLLDLRRRIRAVKSTQQITKAMKMISASKLRRAQDRIVGARPFALQMQRVLNSLAARVDPSTHPLLAEREPGAGFQSPPHRHYRRQRAVRGLQHEHHQGGNRVHQQDAGPADRAAVWWAARAGTSSSVAASKSGSRNWRSSSGSSTRTRNGLPTPRSRSSPAGAWTEYSSSTTSSSR